MLDSGIVDGVYFASYVTVKLSGFFGIGIAPSLLLCFAFGGYCAQLVVTLCV